MSTTDPPDAVFREVPVDGFWCRVQEPHGGHVSESPTDPFRLYCPGIPPREVPSEAIFWCRNRAPHHRHLFDDIYNSIFKASCPGVADSAEWSALRKSEYDEERKLLSGKLGHLLLEEPIPEQGNQRPFELGNIEFKPHICVMSLFIYTTEEHPDEPSEAVCQGCGRRWRLEEEFKS